MQPRQLLAQVNTPPLPGLMNTGPGAANMYKILEQQQQQQLAKQPSEGLPFPADLDIASLALAQQLQAMSQQPHQQRQPAANGTSFSMSQADLLALISPSTIMQSNPALAQLLGFNQAAGRPDVNGSTNPVAAAAAAAAANAAQQARVQQAALAAGFLRAGTGGAGMKPNVATNALGATARLAGQPSPAAGASNNMQNAAQLAALQRAVHVQQLLQHQQTAANQQAQLIQAAAALAAQQQQQQQQQNAQKQAQQLQAQQMLKAVLERNNQANAQQQQIAAALAQNASVNASALMKQLQLHDALAKQDALARAAAAQQASAISPGLAELLLRQQAVQHQQQQEQRHQQQQQQQQQDAANRNAAVAASSLAKAAAALNPVQLQQLASTPAGQALLRTITNNITLQHQHQHQPQLAAAAPTARAAQGLANGATAHVPNTPQGTLDALLAAQSMVASVKQAAANGDPPHTAGGAGADALAGGGGGGGGANGLNGNKEQRRLALACVALQLARSGVSVEQAIQSGIMGGMSVMDVRFIVECYNAECERMKAASNGAGVSNGAACSTPGGVPSVAGSGPMRPTTTSVHSSRTQSPATSMAGSHASMFGLQASQPTTATSVGPATSHAMATKFASLGAAIDGSLSAENGTGAAVIGGSDPGSPPSRVGSYRSKNSGDAAASAAAAAGAFRGTLASGTETSSTHFNAFNYGFFGPTASAPGQINEVNGSGELLGELEPESVASLRIQSSSEGAGGSNGVRGLVGDVTQEELAWLQSTANAHRALWEGQSGDNDAPGHDAASYNDEIAARLANLDLGSGFM